LAKSTYARGLRIAGSILNPGGSQLTFNLAANVIHEESILKV
jgi:hypothetical protein